jgi:hypothetical protein
VPDRMIPTAPPPTVMFEHDLSPHVPRTVAKPGLRTGKITRDLLLNGAALTAPSCIQCAWDRSDTVDP